MASESEFQQLISRLGSSDAAVRNRTAMRLRDFHDDRAVEPLFQATLDPRNSGNRGTLIYVLWDLDCNAHFTDLFQLALHGNYEVQCMALHILKEQDFAADDSEQNKASQELLAFLENPRPIEKVELLIAELQAILVRLQAHGDTGHTA